MKEKNSKWKKKKQNEKKRIFKMKEKNFQGRLHALILLIEGAKHFHAAALLLYEIIKQRRDCTKTDKCAMKALQVLSSLWKSF